MIKYINVDRGKELNLKRFPRSHIAYSIRQIKKSGKWSKDALIVKSGNYYYNVSSEPDIYYKEAH